ncbi:uncharacterized protein LOC128864680 [Anastrepha ludens]|uniref:uncharacterized protein LOC128864680 n=1 Tax=Anastrepha ludens TaxID=28586 RepID=UPI0023B13D78|nr:uncharacterized protein LOC128864680 [Anastrepha ludens]
MAPQMTIIAICFLSFWINATQSETDFDGLLNKVFNDTDGNLLGNVELEPQGKICGIGKECVQRKLCKEDGTVKRFGQGMVDLKIDLENPCTYLETCCKVDEMLEQATPEIVPLVQESHCGTRNAEGVFFKITGATNGEAEFAEFPWMVAISTIEETYQIYTCGGAIIAPNVVLTAAHCVLNQPPEKLVARAGEWDTQTTQEPQRHQDARVKEIISNEDFDPSKIAGDIALLILETPYIWAPNVQPICLPDANRTFDNSRCFATGWGKDKFGKAGVYQVILKKIELPIVPHATCEANLRRTRLSRFFQLDKSFICAGGEGGSDTCKGDGGSPLVCPDPKNPNRYYQAGIVSWGINCGEKNIPGVYSNVPYLRSWINEKLVARGIDFKYFTHRISKMASNLAVFAVCLLSLWIVTSDGQSTPNLDDLLNKIFTTEPTPFQPTPTKTTVLQPEPQPQPQPDPGSGKNCGVDKECVARFLCNEDGAVNTDGSTLIDIRFDGEEQCTYLEVCCNTPDKLEKPKVPIKPDVTHDGCGYRNPDGVGFRITGDKEGESQFGEFPWMVAILRDEVIGGETLNIYECGGAVIAPNVVLTATHCVLNLDPSVLVARAGEWDTQTKQEVLPHQDARVKEIIRHEQYNKGALYNDVALLILETPYYWEENVRPICLPEPDANFDHSRCYATGWGKDKFGKDGTYQLILKKIDLPAVPRDTCEANLRKTRLGKFFNLDKSFLCAGGEKGKDTCKGDGGSPLVCPDPNNPNRYYQAGIVAWGIGCGVENVPGVYANVPYLRNWINEKLSARGIDFKYFTA